MSAVSDLMTSTLQFSRQKLFLQKDMPKLLHESHCAIFQAIIQREPKSARKLMEKHLTMVEQAMIQLKREESAAVSTLNDVTLDHKLEINFGFPS
jgi:GntR family transcriptional repressor for pyruvate dehydrogenase complex